MRDAVDQVIMDVLLAGDFPGDGLPKPVAFPDPAESRFIGEDGLPILPLASHLKLKIASGMTAQQRPRDLDDAIRLIRKSELPRTYVDRLNPFVRSKFDELWQAAQIDEDY